MESAQTAAKASGEGAADAFEARLLPGEGAARHLKPGYCPHNAAKACGKGAARDLLVPNVAF